jgi:hypothetical protein
MSSNIYKKLSVVQRNLLKRDIPKSGKNKFGGFEYYELSDLLPALIDECSKEGLAFLFSFTEEKALIHVYDVDNENSEITNCVIVPELKELNRGMNLIQSYGSYITYLKRYLLLNTFLIGESSYIDSNASEIENKPTHKAPKPKKSTRKTTPVKQRVVVQTFDSAEAYLEYFEKQALQSGLDLTTQTLFKYCTSERKNNAQFKKFEGAVRKLITSKYNGGK